MEIQLNGSPRAVPDDWTIADLLKDLQIQSRYCAVEQNRAVIPREHHASRRLSPGDRIEVVTLVGGG